MKILFPTILIFGFISFSDITAQVESPHELFIEFGIQHSDRRLFDFPQVPASRIKEESHRFHIKQISVGYERFLNTQLKNRFPLKIGGLLTMNTNTFPIPFDSSFGGETYPSFDGILLVNLGYNKFLMSLYPELQSSFGKTGKWKMAVQIRPNFTFLRTVKLRKYNLSRLEFSLDSIEPIVGFQYDSNKWFLSANTRVITFQKFDEIYFAEVLKGDPPSNYEITFFPKVIMAVGRRF